VVYFSMSFGLFVSTLAKWLAGKTYSHNIYRVKGFPLQRPDWRVIYFNGLLYVFPTRNIVNFLINFTFLTATYFSRAQCSLFVLKVLLNPNQSNSVPVCKLFSPCVATMWIFTVGRCNRPPRKESHDGKIKMPVAAIFDCTTLLLLHRSLTNFLKIG